MGGFWVWQLLKNMSLKSLFEITIDLSLARKSQNPLENIQSQNNFIRGYARREDQLFFNQLQLKRETYIFCY